MIAKKNQLETSSDELIKLLGDKYQWRWEESRQALLSEFSRDKKDPALEVLKQYFPDSWDLKAIKKAPHILKEQLGPLTKLTKQQLLFTKPANENEAALLAIWWPWGHGGTYSLRLVILEESYQMTSPNENPDNLLVSLLKKLRLHSN